MINIYDIKGKGNGQVVSAILESFVVDILNENDFKETISHNEIFKSRMENEITQSDLLCLQSEANEICKKIRELYPNIISAKWAGREVQEATGDVILKTDVEDIYVELKRAKGKSKGTLSNNSANTFLNQILESPNVSGYVEALREFFKQSVVGYCVQESGLNCFQKDVIKAISLENVDLYNSLVKSEEECRKAYIKLLSTKRISDNASVFIDSILNKADLTIYVNYKSNSTFEISLKNEDVPVENLSLKFSEEEDRLGFEIYSNDILILRCQLYWKNRVGNNFAINTFEV